MPLSDPAEDLTEAVHDYMFKHKEENFARALDKVKFIRPELYKRYVEDN